MISDFPVMVDAYVLVQAPVRDTLLTLFQRRLFLARWTDEIIEETTRTLQDKLGRTRRGVAASRDYHDWLAIVMEIEQAVGNSKRF
jgi:hypothetical protein